MSKPMEFSAEFKANALTLAQLASKYDVPLTQIVI